MRSALRCRQRYLRALTRSSNRPPFYHAHCCTCSGLKLARSSVSPRCQWLTAIGGEADIGRASRSCRSGAIDPHVCGLKPGSPFFGKRTLAAHPQTTLICDPTASRNSGPHQADLTRRLSVCPLSGAKRAWDAGWSRLSPPLLTPSRHRSNRNSAAQRSPTLDQLQLAVFGLTRFEHVPSVSEPMVPIAMPSSTRAAVADTSIDDQQVAAVPNLDASNDVLDLSETDFVEAR